MIHTSVFNSKTRGYLMSVLLTSGVVIYLASSTNATTADMGDPRPLSPEEAVSGIAEALYSAPPNARERSGEGTYSNEGWTVTAEGQLAWDLGRFYRRGTVEFEVRGPLDQTAKRILFAVWNEAAATDEDRESQSFMQIRLVRHGAQLRLTNRSGGRSFEPIVRARVWPDSTQWVHIKANWDSGGGDCVLSIDGEEVQRGKFGRSRQAARRRIREKEDSTRLHCIQYHDHTASRIPHAFPHSGLGLHWFPCKHE